MSSQTKVKTCHSNQLSFPCPKGLQVKSDGKINSVFVAYSSSGKFSVFAFAPDTTSAAQNSADESLMKALLNLYATKLEDYRWKDSDDFYDDSKFSEYEVRKSAKVGFNKNRRQTVHAQYVRLSYNRQDVIAGFIYELENGGRAEEVFNDWSGGGNGEASDGLQELIIKITGEKKSTETPGGPPPAAMPKNN